jgi:hypothetical protein
MEISMSKTLAAAVLAILATSPAAFAASAEDCTAMWKKADAKAEGKISGDMAKPYMAAMEAMKMPAAMAKDGVVSDKEFLDACMKDAFKDVK